MKQDPTWIRSSDCASPPSPYTIGVYLTNIVMTNSNSFISIIKVVVGVTLLKCLAQNEGSHT